MGQSVADWNLAVHEEPHLVIERHLRRADVADVAVRTDEAFSAENVALNATEIADENAGSVSYEIEKLVGHEWFRKPTSGYQLRYEIKWIGYEQTTFEPVEHIPSNLLGQQMVKVYNEAKLQFVCKCCGFQRAFTTACGLRLHS